MKKVHILSIWTRDDYGDEIPSLILAEFTKKKLIRLFCKYLVENKEMSVDLYMEEEEYISKITKLIRDMLRGDLNTGPELDCAYVLDYSEH